MEPIAVEMTHSRLVYRIVCILAGAGFGFVSLSAIIPNLPETQPVFVIIAGLIGGIIGGIIGTRIR
jgi:uncharacterized membrane protein YccC